VTFDGYDSYLPEYQGPYASYNPETIDAEVSVSESCCINRGDVNHDGRVDALDISFFVDWLWSGGPNPPCEQETDLDASTQVDGLDLTYLVDYMWQSGPPPVGCF
jgi:hypothetical protein